MATANDSQSRQTGPSRDAALAELAARQHGIATIEQMRQLGFGARMVQHRAARGLLHRRHRGVYAVGHPALTPDGVRMAAVLACGDRAVLSHRAAGALWGLVTAVRLDVTTSARGRRGMPGVVLHRTRRLGPGETTSHRAIPVTTVSRTLVDLAGVLDGDRLARAVHEAEILGLLNRRNVDEALRHASGRRGTGKLRAILADPARGLTRSELETRFVALCRRTGLPAPRMNTTLRIGDGVIEVDALWPEQRLIVELDGAAVHNTRRAFHADRRRDLALAAEGYLVARLTWERVTRKGDEAASEIRRVLALRGP